MTVDFPAPLGPMRDSTLPLGYREGDGIHHSFAVVLFCQFFYLQPTLDRVFLLLVSSR